MTPGEFEAHPIWSLLDRVSDQLTKIDANERQEDSRQADEIRELLSYALTFRDSADVLLVTEGSMQELVSPWQNIENYLSTYLQDPTGYQGNLSNARGQLDAVRAAVARLPRSAATPAVKAAITRGLASYLELLEGGREELAAKLAATRAEQEAIDSNHATEVEKLTAEIAALSAQLSAAEQRVISSESRLDSALTTSNEAFITSQTARDKEFKSWLEEQGSNLEELATPRLDAIAAAQTESQQHLNAITKLRTSTVAMSNLAAGDILADNYEKSAAQERNASYVGYIAGAAALLLGAVALLFAFGNISGGLEWPHVVLKIGLTATAGALAAAAFRFGGQALARSTSFKRQELELRALSPFLSDVEPAEASKIRQRFVDRSFGRAFQSVKAPADAPASQDAVPLGEALRLATTIAERLPKP